MAVSRAVMEPIGSLLLLRCLRTDDSAVMSDHRSDKPSDGVLQEQNRVAAQLREG